MPIAWFHDEAESLPERRAAGGCVHRHHGRAAPRVLEQSGRRFQNIYAAGEIMSGNILTKGYLGGFGLTIGSVFGRLAGTEAAKHARA